MFGQTSERFTVKNININTTNNEFGTVISKSGGIYYLKSRFKGQTDLDELSANLYKGELSERGEITKGVKFPTDAIHAVFTNDARTVYYSKKVGNKFQLFKAYVDNTGTWKSEIRLPINDFNFNFKQPALSIDNYKLFFVSDKSDSNGSTDIYYVDIKNSGLEYGEPVHLSFYVNSPGEEIFPCIGENDKIYFSSDGMGGEGGLDIYESFLSNGQYEKTANLGTPINSEFDDFAYTLISGNSKGYFSSNRQDGKGGVDIYYFEDKKPTLNNCSQSISGFVKNKENQKPVFEAIVEVFDSKGNNENTLTDQNGQFTIDNVECEATYDIVAYKEGFNGFAEAHTNPKSNAVINLFLNPEFPEGFKEEFDLNNEMVAIDTKTNEIIIPEKNKPADKKVIPINKEESNTVVVNKPKVEKKAVEKYYDPLDYDPYSQAKKTTPKKVVEDEPKKEVIAKKEDIDPLDYDPYSQSPKKKEVVITKNTEIEIDSKPKKEVVADYDPLDYDPKTQSKNAPKQKAQEVNQIEETKKKTEIAQQERQKRIAEAKATADKLKIAEDAKNTEIAQRETQKKVEAENQPNNSISNSNLFKYHAVQKGEGLYSIAKNNNLTVEELKTLNNLKNNNISVGQKLIVSKSDPFKQNNGLEIASSDLTKENQSINTQKNQTTKTYNADEFEVKQSRIDKANETYVKLLKEKEKIMAQKNALSKEIQKTENKENDVCAKNINGNVLNSKTRKALSNVTIDMYFDGQNLESTTTDESGNFNFYNVDCNTKYTLICYRENFDNIAKAIIDTNNDPKDITILLEPNVNKAIADNSFVKKEIPQNSVSKNKSDIKTEVSGKIDKNDKEEMTYFVEPKIVEVPKVESGKIAINPIYFDLDEWYLTSEARRELDKIIVLMKMNPTMIIESGSHTDTRGRFEYNLELSEKRSQETVGYLVANGADSDRISGRGYGETMPVNQCLDGVKCAENEHLQNRRTEFVILKY